MINPLGLMGLMVSSWKKCLHIIKEQFYKLCFDFYDGSVNVQSDHNAFIALIPKKANPEFTNDRERINSFVPVMCSLQI